MNRTKDENEKCDDDGIWVGRVGIREQRRAGDCGGRGGGECHKLNGKAGRQTRN